MEQGKISALLDVSAEAADYLQRIAGRGAHEDEVDELLQNLRRIAALIETEMQDTEGLRKQIYLYAKNIQASIDDLEERPALYERILRMEIRPFILEMQRIWFLDSEVLADAERIKEHRQNIMKQAVALHHTPQEHYEYDVSILLLAYNKLDYTKRAAESILAHTDFLSRRIELITLNNGSDDGTREYFESLPHAKVINLKHNIPGTYSYMHSIGGKYYIVFSNDVVATPHWLEHLLICMESDARIAIAVPTCNQGSISNLQGVPVPYRNVFEDMGEMQVFASSFNQLNPKKWEERSQLMPFLSIMHSDMIPLFAADPIYTKVDFIDDDVSTLLRRSGWRQMLLKDTFMHHFGGVTLGAERTREKGNALDAMRRVYYDKWGVDAWDSRGCFAGIENIWDWHTFAAGARLLMLEPRFGDLACQLYNHYRQESEEPHMTAVVFDERYLPDTDYLFDVTIASDSIGDAAVRCAMQYDLISAGCYLDELPLDDVIADLKHLYDLLVPGGMLLLPVRNVGSAYELDKLLNGGARDTYSQQSEVRRFSSIPYKYLLTALSEHPQMRAYRIFSIMVRDDTPLVEQFLPLISENHSDRGEVERSLKVRMFFLGIFKPLT